MTLQISTLKKKRNKKNKNKQASLVNIQVYSTLILKNMTIQKKKERKITPWQGTNPCMVSCVTDTHHYITKELYVYLGN